MRPVEQGLSLPGHGQAEYDYSTTGVWLVSVHTRGDEFPLATPGLMNSLSDYGRIAYDGMTVAMGLRPGMKLDRLAVLSDRVNAITAIADCPRLGGECGRNSECRGRAMLCHAPLPGDLGTPSTRTIEAVVEHFKAFSCRGFSRIKGRITSPECAWQGGFFQKAVRDDLDLARARKRINR